MIEIKFEKGQNRAIALDNSKQIGECDFTVREEIWNIIHTEVDNAYQGQGIARRLVDCIIENARKYNAKVIADCSYAKKVLERYKK